MSGNDYYLVISDDDDKIDISSPKHTHSRRKKPLFSKADKKRIKFWLIVLAFSLIFVFYEPILMYLQELLRTNPTIHKFYLGIESEIRGASLLGLLYVSVLGSLFFLALPGEAIFIYFLSKTNYFLPLIIVIAVLGNLVGLILNYLIGRILGVGLVKKIFKKNYEKYETRILKYGGPVLLIGNIIPSPIELLTVFYGSFKYSFSRYIYLSFIGRVFKYAILSLLFYFFWDKLTILYEDIMVDGFLAFWRNLF